MMTKNYEELLRLYPNKQDLLMVFRKRLETCKDSNHVTEHEHYDPLASNLKDCHHYYTLLIEQQKKLGPKSQTHLTHSHAQQPNNKRKTI